MAYLSLKCQHEVNYCGFFFYMNPYFECSIKVMVTQINVHIVQFLKCAYLRTIIHLPILLSSFFSFSGLLRSQLHGHENISFHSFKAFTPCAATVGSVHSPYHCLSQYS